MIRRLLPLLVLLPATGCQHLRRGEGDGPTGPASIESATQGLDHRPGLFDLYVDHERARVLALLPPAGPPRYGRVMTACLYVEGLASGLGSNPVGLDRGQVGETRVVAFRRLGDRVLVEQPNLAYRARSEDEAERRAVQESFASSVLWSGEVLAEDEFGATLVDLTSFLVRDAHGSARTMQQAGQGSWQLDAQRSVLDTDSVLAFPDNLEFDALLTFQGEQPGREVRSTAPTPHSVTLVQHHSFVRLPDGAYRSRALDPRMGHFGVDFLDHAAPVGAPNRVSLAVRHRLQRVDPARASSPAIEPIVYHVDRGVPEPVRSALLEGASWWAEAFEAAGFEKAFRVQLLPEGAHPLDVRYNVIQWVHRSTRGWSYGGGVIDPRTGEMIKGHVSLGSLRVRQDRLLFEGLLGAEGTGSGGPDDPVELALARIRQLSAHEVGHTLGLAHNFSASTYGRASVMDYPAPLVRLDEQGEIDVSEAYAVGVGDWDVHAIRWLYSEFPQGVDEAEALTAIVAEGQERGLHYHSDSDARGLGSALPRASLWDNGEDAVSGLEEALAVRARALERFGERNLAAGRPRAELEEVLVPLYFHHRYQLHAAAKTIGGLDYHHAHVGDPLPLPRPIPGSEQRRALEACLRALSPETLALPLSVLALLGPPTPVDGGGERFERSTGPAFDSLGAARSAARLVVELLFEPSRCARLQDMASQDASLPSLESVLVQVVDTAFTPQATSRGAALAEAVQHTVLDGLMDLAGDGRTTPEVRAVAERVLMNMAEQTPQARRAWDPRGTFVARIQRFLERGFAPGERFAPAAQAPPGSPIGADLEGHLGSCSCP